jgi:AraC-like DNA-binding protein
MVPHDNHVGSSMREPKMPSCVERIATADPEVVHRYYERRKLPKITRVFHSPGADPYGLQIIEKGDAAMAWTTLRARETSWGRVPHTQVQMVLAGRAVCRIGRQREITAVPGDIVCLPVDVDFTLVREPGRYCNWMVPAQEVAAVLARLRGERGGRYLTPPVHLSASPAERHELEDLLDAFALSFDEDGKPRSAPVAAWLAHALVRSTKVARLSEASVARLDRLEAWLDANIQDQITLPDLCAVAGCGQRALQKLIAARHGVSPMAFVRQRRLALVRDRLSDERECLVTEAALDHGLNHLGRLAQAYRQLFGESPVETRRKRGEVELDAVPAPSPVGS